jgi:hypothetical protein
LVAGVGAVADQVVIRAIRVGVQEPGEVEVEAMDTLETIQLPQGQQLHSALEMVVQLEMNEMVFIPVVLMVETVD